MEEEGNPYMEATLKVFGISSYLIIVMHIYTKKTKHAYKVA